MNGNRNVARFIATKLVLFIACHLLRHWDLTPTKGLWYWLNLDSLWHVFSSGRRVNPGLHLHTHESSVLINSCSQPCFPSAQGSNSAEEYSEINGKHLLPPVNTTIQYWHSSHTILDFQVQMQKIRWSCRGGFLWMKSYFAENHDTLTLACFPIRSECEALPAFTHAGVLCVHKILFTAVGAISTVVNLCGNISGQNLTAKLFCYSGKYFKSCKISHSLFLVMFSSVPKSITNVHAQLPDEGILEVFAYWHPNFTHPYIIDDALNNC